MIGFYGIFGMAHIDFHNHPMKVSLAMQTSGRRNAAAIAMFSEKPGMSEMETEGTRKFVNIVGTLIFYFSQI